MPLLAARGRPRRVAAAAGVAAGVLLAAGPAVAGGAIVVIPSTVGAGGAVMISGLVPTTGGAACPARDKAVLISAAALFPPGGIGPPVSRSATGAFQLRYTVPGATVAGIYRIGVRCGGAAAGVQARLRVTAPVRRVPAGAPRTGSGGGTATRGSGRWLVGMGALLMGIGFYLGVAELAPWRSRRR